MPARGLALDPPARRSLEAARTLVDDPRIAAISITDNAGGHAMASPVPLAEELLARGQDVIVHVACRDRSRNALRSLAWELQARGIRNVLAVSGDHPVEGTGGLSRPVFDLDSVGLISLYHDLVNEPGPDGAEHAPGLYLAAAVSPFKRLESEVILQYLKLGLKARAGADFVIPQLGYDSRKWDELLRWMRLHDLRLPVLANVYVLTRTVARLFNANAIPGCVVSDELLALDREGGRRAGQGQGLLPGARGEAGRDRPRAWASGAPTWRGTRCPRPTWTGSSPWPSRSRRHGPTWRARSSTPRRAPSSSTAATRSRASTPTSSTRAMPGR